MENIWIGIIMVGASVVCGVSFIFITPIGFLTLKWLVVYQDEGGKENYIRYKRYMRIWRALLITMIISGVVMIIDYLLGR